MKISSIVSGVVSLTCILSGKSSLELTTQEVALPTLNKISKSRDFCTEDSILPWEDRFHEGGTGYIDGIRPDDLTKPVMCGIDRWGRAFMALKYVCRPKGEDKSTVGAVAYFQRYTDRDLVALGGHYQAEGCDITQLDPSEGYGYTGDLGKLLDEENVRLYGRYHRKNEVVASIKLCDKDSCPEPLLKLPAPDSTDLVV